MRRIARLNSICYYLEVNDNKLSTYELPPQISKVAKYIAEKNNIEYSDIKLKFGTVNDQHIRNKCTIEIKYNRIIKITISDD